MIQVEYSHRYEYRIHLDSPSPILTIELRSPNTGLAVEQDVSLDSGASRSIFKGEIPAMLGLRLLDGDPWNFVTNTGQGIEARIHDVELVLPPSGDEPAPMPIAIKLAFAMADIQRNLLGRDFFNEVQIGFRERRIEFFVRPVP